MDTAHLLVFAAAYLTVVLVPGPAVTALVARVLTRGTQGAPAYIAGFVTGSLLWFSIAAAGLAAMASALGSLFVAIRYAGAGYLLYLAWKLWTSASRPLEATDRSPEGSWALFLAGAAINLGNPKAVIFFLALLPSVVDLDTLTPLGFAELAAIVAAVVMIVFGCYAAAAARARRLFSSPRAIRLLNRGGGMALAGAAAAIAAR
jgi:threonine/homoserine/homoserine lactone efflux protein